MAQGVIRRPGTAPGVAIERYLAHWVDVKCDCFQEPRGAVALFGDRRIEIPDPNWRALWSDEEFLPERTATGVGIGQRRNHMKRYFCGRPSPPLSGTE